MENFLGAGLTFFKYWLDHYEWPPFTINVAESRPPDIRHFFRSESFCAICLVKALDIGPYGGSKFP
jgi:hypothetical protein